jgi:hypothetical protein
MQTVCVWIYSAVYVSSRMWYEKYVAGYQTNLMFLNTEFNTVLPPFPKCTNWAAPFRKLRKYFSPLNMLRVLSSCYSSVCYHNDIWWVLQIMKLLISTGQYSPFCCLNFLTSKFGTLFSGTLCRWSFPRAGDRVKIPCETTGKIVSQWILIFTFPDKRRKGELIGSRHFANLIVS